MAEIRLSLPKKPCRGLEFEITPESINGQGLGVADLFVELGPQKLNRKYRVEIRGALPFEKVKARVLRIERKVIQAEVIEYLSRSSMRQDARCKHIARYPRKDKSLHCGGCVLQELGQADQMTLKVDRVKKLLTHKKIDIELVQTPIICDEDYFYRNKMEYSFANNKERTDVELGLHPPGYRHDVVPLDECYLLSEFASSYVPALRAWIKEKGLEAIHFRDGSGFLRTLMIREGKRTNERMIILTTTPENEIITKDGRKPAKEIIEAFKNFTLEFVKKENENISSIYWSIQKTERGKKTEFIDHVLYGAEILKEEMKIDGLKDALKFEIHPRAFFQPNTKQAEILYAEVLKAVKKSGAEKNKAFDLYCGTGTISLALAHSFKEVIGAELCQEAVENAKRNAKLNQIDNCRFFSGDVGKLLEKELSEYQDKIDLIVVDPPRSGLLPAALAHLTKLKAPKLLYVSCNPESLARDLLELRKRGFEAISIQPVDMFPHTGHIENVALLTH